MQTTLPTATVEAADDGFISLDGLFAEVMQNKADTQRLKEGRKALKEGRMPVGVSLDELQADLRKLEAVREWLAVADVAMFQVQHCTSCENYNPVFTGRFQRQQSRHHRKAQRWVTALPSENRGLPKEVKTSETDVPFCHFCLEEAGYPAEQLGILFDEEPAGEEEAQLDFEAGQDAIAELLDTTITPETPPETTLESPAMPTPQPEIKYCELTRVLAARDNLTLVDAQVLVDEAREEVSQGADPEELLHEEFGLEPDYVFDLL